MLTIRRDIRTRSSGMTQQTTSSTTSTNPPNTIPAILRYFNHPNFPNQSWKLVICVFQLEYIYTSRSRFNSFSTLVKLPLTPVCTGIRVQQSSPIISQIPCSPAIRVSITNLFCRVISEVACNCSRINPTPFMVKFINLC